MFEHKLTFIYLVSICNIKMYYYIIKKFGTSKTIYSKDKLSPYFKDGILKTRKKLRR